MFTEDYVLRMISLATAALAQALGLKAAGKLVEARQVLEGSLEELLGIPPRLLPYLEEDNLFQAVSSQRAPDQERTRITAELLELYGNIHGEMGSTAEETRLLHNALLLYLESYLSREASPEMEHSEAIDQLVQKLPPGSFSRFSFVLTISIL